MTMTPTQKPGLKYYNGIPIMVPNTTYQGDGFHISHNDRDWSIYGDVTTALVVKGGSAFYVLNGDHRAGYIPLVPEGLDACLAYFRQHMGQMNKFSEMPPATDGPESI